jgi:uncharacterized membrane protein
MSDRLDGVVIHSSPKRTAVKAASYRVLSVLLDFAVIYLFTRKLALTIGIALVSNTASALLYFVHERFWNRFTWGRHAHRIPH